LSVFHFHSILPFVCWKSAILHELLQSLEVGRAQTSHLSIAAWNVQSVNTVNHKETRKRLTGSQPWTAGKPVVLHPTEEPATISLRPW
jgi:hypothetical protein